MRGDAAIVGVTRFSDTNVPERVVMAAIRGELLPATWLPCPLAMAATGYPPRHFIPHPQARSWH